MCGLVGMAGNLNYQTNKMFRDMLIFDQVRGVDSTGLMFVPLGDSKNYKVEKVVGTPNYLWDLGMSEIFSKATDQVVSVPKALLGHNRAATVGAVGVDTAHPFEFEKLVGMHNGTLAYRNELDKLPEFKTDSQELLYTINNHGVDEAWKRFIGAAALVWWDKEEETVNFLRNKERDLFYAYSKDKTAVFWASEFWMIKIAAQRSRVELEKEGDNIIYRPFTENTHYTFKPSAANVELVSVRKIEERPFPTAISKHVGFGRNTMAMGGTNIVNFSSIKRGGRGASLFHQGGIRPEHLDWSQGTKKEGKETRGLEFTINGCGKRGDLEYMVGAIIDETGNDFVNGVYLEIINTNEEVFRQIMRSRYDDRIWKTTARCRSVVDPKLELKKLRISCMNIYPTEERIIEDINYFTNPNLETSYKRIEEVLPKSLITLYKDGFQEMVKETVYTLPTGLIVNEAAFRNYLAHTACGSCCYGCGNPLEIKEHESFMWVDDKTVVCPDCADEFKDNIGLAAR